LREDSPLQRYIRDLGLLVVPAFLHMDTAAETSGRIVFGLLIEDRLI